jgi:outer membrane lipoprotein carrier protein
MRRRAWLVVAWWALAGAAPSGADAVPAPDPSACVQAAVGAAQARYRTLRDLSARFEQESRSVAFGAGATVARSSGEVVFAKPGKMRWTYREPEPSLVVSDGEWLWIYDPAAREAQKLGVGDGALSGAAVQFLLGEGEILAAFQVEAETCSATEAHLTLVPREPAPYETLRIVVDPRSGDLRETEVVDLLGNATRVAFQDLRADTGPAPEMFQFQAPEGVEVIELSTTPR